MEIVPRSHVMIYVMEESLKLQTLNRLLADMRSVLVAYSGGVDSTLLLKVAADVLGHDRVLAVTASSETYPRREIEAAKSMATFLGVRHLVIHTNELDDPAFASNPPDRCYYCKRKLFARLSELARDEGLNFVVDGSNSDDEADFRPGRRAALEFNVKSPLLEAGLTKEEIRQLSKAMNLPTWDKPPFPCLSTRFPYGTEITREKLLRVQRAEEYLSALGISQVRVRDHGDIARIEVRKAEIPALLREEVSQGIIDQFKALGFTYVAVDLQGYRTGSMNESLHKTTPEKR